MECARDNDGIMYKPIVIMMFVEIHSHLMLASAHFFIMSLCHILTACYIMVYEADSCIT